MPILQSNFADDSTVVDDANTLFAGKETITSPTLTVNLSDSETEVFYIDDAEGLPKQGFAAIDDEVIFYSSRYGAYEIRYLQRGQNGTTPASHTHGATVTFTPVFYIPESFRAAIIAMQEYMISVEARVTALEP